MKKFVGLLLCLSLSFFIVARAAKPSHTPLSQNEISSEESYLESESFDRSDAEHEEVAVEKDTDEEVASADDDSMQNASDDEGEEMNDEPGDAGDQATGDDEGGDDNGSDDGGDDGSGDEGE
jgi:hypothetical protein